MNNQPPFFHPNILKCYESDVLCANVCFLFCAVRGTISFICTESLAATGWLAMKIGDWLKSEVEYGRNLADSGWEGARTALEGQHVGAILGHSARASWAPTMIGAGVGTVCGLLLQRRKPQTAAVVALGVIGGVVGFTAGVAWDTRELSSGIARGAMRKIGSTRDSHWLDRHPINFG
jgi:hypothetical protein